MDVTPGVGEVVALEEDWETVIGTVREREQLQEQMMGRV